MLKKLCFSLLAMSAYILSSCSGPSARQEVAVLPTPVQLTTQSGMFVLKNGLKIGVSDESLLPAAQYLQTILQNAVISTAEVGGQPADIFLKLTDTKGKEGAYKLNVTSGNIVAEAADYSGIISAISTLRQLLPAAIEQSSQDASHSIPAVSIEDAPRLAWRGMMLDASRHFWNKEEVKHVLDMMALYKLNKFHWHLTDDQGWRLEIKSLPELTNIGAWRAPRVGNWWEREPQLSTDSLSYGGFYTPEDIREVVDYARKRYITIVPEIDIPGHSMAALSAYPEISCTGGPFHVNVGNTFYTKTENSLCAGNERTFEVLDTVFSEVARLFPSPYIHIGGDECYKGFWERCPKCRMRKQKEHLKNSEELQSYFIKRVANMVQKKGKQVIGWDEILEGGLAPEAIVMSWRGIKGGAEAARQGHSVIMTPSDHCYLDFYQGDPTVEPNTYAMLRLQDCYKYQLIPDSINPSLVMGGQGNLWTESVPHYRQVEYMVWPRALAISETLWTDARLRNWKFFVHRVEQQFERFDQSGVNYARSIYDPIICPHRDKKNELKIELKTEVEGLSLFYTFDNTIPDVYSNMYTDTLSVPKNASMLRVVTYKGQTQAGRQVDVTIEELKKRVTE